MLDMLHPPEHTRTCRTCRTLKWSPKARNRCANFWDSPESLWHLLLDLHLDLLLLLLCLHRRWISDDKCADCLKEVLDLGQNMVRCWVLRLCMQVLRLLFPLLIQGVLARADLLCQFFIWVNYTMLLLLFFLLHDTFHWFSRLVGNHQAETTTACPCFNCSSRSLSTWASEWLELPGSNQHRTVHCTSLYQHRKRQRQNRQITTGLT